MNTKNKYIRISAKAVIISGGKLLVLKKQDSDGYYFTLPGGGQEHGESLESALIRECKEEISANVIMKRLLFVRDNIAVNHEILVHAQNDLHEIELVFEAEIVDGVPMNGSLPDKGQLSLEWLELKNIESERLYPKAIRNCLSDLDSVRSAIYLGDVN